MPLKNAFWPRPDQMDAFLKADNSGPFVMINLLSFKARAEFADGRETDMTGAEIYRNYVEEFTKLIRPIGGEVLQFGPFDTVLIGEGQNDWDATLIVRFPDRSKFIELISSEAYATVAPIRAAGVKDQLLLASTSYA